MPARVGSVRPGTVFAPFHYGYWDTPADGPAHPRAANELTMTEWDPVSKQPFFKTAACRVSRVGDATGPAPAPTGRAAPIVADVAVGGNDALVEERVAETVPHRPPPPPSPPHTPGVPLPVAHAGRR